MSWNHHRPVVQQLQQNRVPIFPAPAPAPVPFQHARLMTYQGLETAFEPAPSSGIPAPLLPPPSQPPDAYSFTLPPAPAAYFGHPAHPPQPVQVQPAQLPSPILPHVPTWKQKYMRARVEQQQTKGKGAAGAVPKATTEPSRPTGLGSGRGCSSCTAPKIK